MHSIRPRYLEQAGYSVVQWNLAIALSNVLSAYLAGNRRPAFRTAISDDVAGRVYEMTMGKASEWGVIGNPKAGQAPFDTRDQMSAMIGKISDFMSQVFAAPVYLNDLGECNRKELSSKSDFYTEHFVVQPATGWPRSYLQFTPDARTKTGGVRMPGLRTPWSEGIARTLLLLDQGRFSSELIPAGSDVGHFTPRDQPFGALLVLRDQVRAIFRMFLLYAIQGPLLSLHANWRYLSAGYDIAYMTDRRAHTALAVWREEAEYLMSLPLHPVLSLVAAGAQTGSIFTYSGVRALLLRADDAPHLPSPEETTKKPIAQGAVCEAPAGSHLRDAILSEAMEDYSSGLATPCEGDVWGAEATLKAEAALLPLSVGTLYRRLKGLGKLADALTTIATMLGWSKLSTHIGELDAASDFVLCDGLGYSAEPGGPLLGLRPVLSLGNPQVSGFSIRFDENFNSKGSAGAAAPEVITWSTMVVHGHQGQASGQSQLERLYLPAGMWMGETEIDQIHSLTIKKDDKFSEAVASHFKDLSPAGYVQQYYGRSGVVIVPNLASGAKFVQTDWDAVAFNSSFNDVRTAWVGGMIDYLQSENRQLYITRAPNTFNHRFIVQMARGNMIEQYNELGNFVAYDKFDGKIVYDHADVAVNSSTTDLERLVDAAPLGPRVSAPPLTGPAAEEPKLGGTP